MNAHAESLDAKAGVVLGFTGVLVGLGATAQPAISGNGFFGAGLVFAELAALFAAWAFLPRRYPVLHVRRLRDRYLTFPETFTQRILLDTQIEMIKELAGVLKWKGRKVGAAVGCLAVAVVLVVVGISDVVGGNHHGSPRPTPAVTSPGTHASSQPARAAALRP